MLQISESQGEGPLEMLFEKVNKKVNPLPTLIIFRTLTRKWIFSGNSLIWHIASNSVRQLDDLQF